MHETDQVQSNGNKASVCVGCLQTVDKMLSFAACQGCTLDWYQGRRQWDRSVKSIWDVLHRRIGFRAWSIHVGIHPSLVWCVCVCLPGIRFASCHVTYLFGHHLQEQHLICGYASGGPQKAARVFASYYHKQQQQQQQQQENAHTATEC